MRGPWRLPLPSAGDALLGWSRLYGLLRGDTDRNPDLFDVVYARDFDDAERADDVEATACATAGAH